MSTQVALKQKIYETNTEYNAPDAYIKNSNNYLQTAIIIICLIIIFWITAKIGTLILRIITGLTFMSCSVYGIWYILRSMPK